MKSKSSTSNVSTSVVTNVTSHQMSPTELKQRRCTKFLHENFDKLILKSLTGTWRVHEQFHEKLCTKHLTKHMCADKLYEIHDFSCMPRTARKNMRARKNTCTKQCVHTKHMCTKTTCARKILACKMCARKTLHEKLHEKLYEKN